jgi:hypothetical protein
MTKPKSRVATPPPPPPPPKRSHKKKAYAGETLTFVEFEPSDRPLLVERLSGAVAGIALAEVLGMEKAARMDAVFRALGYCHDLRSNLEREIAAL